MKKSLCLILALTLAYGAQAFLFGPKGGGTAEKKKNVRKQREEMLTELYASNPELKKTLKEAAGYATFKQVNVNLLLLATANGYGMVVDNGTKAETFMRMGSLGGGVGAGVKDVRVVFVFHNPQVMRQFIEQGLQFGGQADAAAKYAKTGVAAQQDVKGTVDYKDGTVSGGSSSSYAAGTKPADATGGSVATRGAMEVYQFTESGVSLQATVSGTKYWKDAELNR